MPPHPTFGTSAGSRNADCGPGFRQDTFSQVGAGYRGERLIEPSSSPDVGKGTFSQVITLGVCVRAIPFLDASLGVVRPSAFVALDSRLPWFRQRSRGALNRVSCLTVSAMPLDVLGRTRATLNRSTCSPFPRGTGKPLNTIRGIRSAKWAIFGKQKCS